MLKLTTLIYQNVGSFRRLLELPNELLLEILSHLSGIEHKRLRLVVRRLKELVTPFVFTTAHIAARRQVFETFRALSNHLELAQHVVEIIYDGSWFDDTIAEHHMLATEVPGSYEIPDPESRGKSVEAFLEQERILLQELTSAVHVGIKRFPRLRRLIWADFARSPGFRSDRIEDLGPLFRIGATQWAETKPAMTHESTRMYYGLIVLLKALSQPDCKAQITDLRLGDGAYARGDSYISQGGVPDVVFKALSDNIYGPSFPFEYLRRLDITIDVARTINEHEDTSQHRQRFPHFPHLECLCLVAPICSPSAEYDRDKLREPAIRLPGFFCGKAHWPKLRALELKWVRFEAQYLVKFFEQHKDTLEYINLHEVHIPDRSVAAPLRRAFRSWYPDLSDEAYQFCWPREVDPQPYYALVLDFTLYDGQESFSSVALPVDDEYPADDYDEDRVSNYSVDESLEDDGRCVWEELGYSNGGDTFAFETEAGEDFDSVKGEIGEDRTELASSH
ncbi:MAG: hypothetical protein LQ344_002694 [Seirophora lacunosa]|nr:MAG: hypothetical protein LQ344_002694 [Seirophora lacunosa]